MDASAQGRSAQTDTTLVRTKSITRYNSTECTGVACDAMGGKFNGLMTWKREKEKKTRKTEEKIQNRSLAARSPFHVGSKRASVMTP